MTPEKTNNLLNKSCPKCGHDKGENDQECSNCGIIYERYEKVQNRKHKEKENFTKNTALKKEQVEKKRQQAAEQKIKKEQSKQERKNKIKKLLQPSPKKVISILLTLILFVVVAIFYAKNKRESDYISNLRLANSVMALSTIKCVEMSEKYSTVWREAINDKYNDDFNDDIREQRRKFVLYGDIKEIDQSKELAENLLQKLNQSTDLYPEAHRKIVALYGVYSQIHSLAQSPSGSLMSYNKQVNDLQSEYIKIINEIKVLLPKEKE